MLECGFCLIPNHRQPYAAVGVRVNNPLLKAVKKLSPCVKATLFEQWH